MRTSERNMNRSSCARILARDLFMQTTSVLNWFGAHPAGSAGVVAKSVSELLLLAANISCLHVGRRVPPGGFGRRFGRWMWIGFVCLFVCTSAQASASSPLCSGRWWCQASANRLPLGTTTLPFGVRLRGGATRVG